MLVDQGPDPTLKRIARWTAILGTAIGAILALILVVRTFLSDFGSFKVIVAEHVRAVVGIPMAAVSAFCIVVVLEATAGNIEFKAFGFEFSGASGPVVLWVFAFLAFSSAIRFLW
ncbi:MAG TPA: hypothetical protein VHB47_24930 [Thermoanaerobaculia bacterium]|jgi:hypothetical protein|nr:hypothetical protein [Thermoanaerobaculia bacterium]